MSASDIMRTISNVQKRIERLERFKNPVSPGGVLPGYLPLDGSLAMTGDLDMGGNDIVNIGSIPVLAHAASHEAGGSDLVGHDSLTGWDANKHIDHTAVTLTAGAGLTGGGDISASRTFAVGAGTLITVDADTVGITPGANYQFIGTGAGTAAAWQNLSALAGDGLDHALGVLSVDVTDIIDTNYGLTESSNNIRINLAATSGLNFSSGALLVGAGDGIDVLTNTIAVDVTDIIDTAYGLTENSNNIRVNIGTGMAFSSGALYAYALRQSDYGDNALVADAAGDLTAYGSLAFNVAESITTNAGDLTINPAVKVVVLSDMMLDGDSRIYEEYVSGYFGAGYAIGYDGVKSYLEVDDLTVRHTLRTHIFQYDIVRATNGYLYIADSSEITQPASGSYIYVKEPVFAVGDLLWYKDYDLGDTLSISSVQMTVTAGPTVVSNNGVDHQRYTVTANSGSLSDLSAGGTVVRVGNTTDTDRQGALYMDASSTFSPFMDIIDSVDSWVAFGASDKTKVRLGNLEGITSTAEYGLWAGEGVGVGDSYLLVSNVNIALHDIPMFFYDSGNNQRIGMVPDADSTDKLMWAGESESNPGFVVYGDGDVWLSTLAISEQMGDMLFSQADGLALWGPGCAITPTSWTSTRGQVATISGAFHQVQGPWAETRALLVESTTTNYNLSPRMKEDGSTGLAAGWAYFDNFGSGGSATLDVEPHPIAERGWLQRATYTASAGDSTHYMLIYSQTAAASFAQNDWVTASLDIKGEVVGCEIFLQIIEYDSSTVLGTVHSKVITITPELQRISFSTQMVDADCDKVRFRIYVRYVDNGDSFDIWFGAVNVEKARAATSFCCGALPYCDWSGTTDYSTSIRAATVVNLSAHAGLINQNDTLSFSIWIQVPYDSDATWPVSGYNYVFYALDDIDNQIILAYDSADDMWSVNINNGERIQSTAQSFSAGDWLNLALTLDYSANAYVLYVNGVADGSDTTSLTAPTLDEWQLCSGGGYADSMTFGEYAVFGRVLTANEVAALYTQGKPLADMGAFKRPGIYILDGEFDLRSSQTGARVQIDANGIGGYSAATTKTFSLETDGDLFLGSNISAAATTAFAVFATAQTYNYESVGAGDVLLGDNSTGKINLLWDVSEGDVILRRGTSARITLDGSADQVIIGATATENILITSTAVQIRDGATVLTELVGGELILGDDGTAQDWISISSANGIRVYSNNTLLGQWTTGGNVIIGEVAASKDNILISAGALSIRNNKTERIGMTAAGVLTINDSGGNAVFTFNASAGAEFTRPLSIATTGGIYQGSSGSFGSPGTGLKIWNDGGVGRIAGYNSTNIQWYANTDGKLYAGDGAVSLSSAGIRLTEGSAGILSTATIMWPGTVGFAIGSGTSSGSAIRSADITSTIGNIKFYWYFSTIAGKTQNSITIGPNDSADYLWTKIENGGLYVGNSNLGVTAAGAPSVGEIWSDGSVFVGGSGARSNSFMTTGITINQGAADDEILALQSSDVAHGMTALANTTTYGVFKKAEATSGGLAVLGYKDADGTAALALQISGQLGENADTTKSTSGRGIVEISASIKSGTGIGAVNTDGNVLVIRPYGATRFIFDAEGSAHADVEWITFDAHDDVALLDKLESTMLAQSFGGFVNQHRDELQRLGIAHFDERPGHAMVNWTRLSMLHTGAIRQLYARIMEQDREIAALKLALTG